MQKASTHERVILIDPTEDICLSERTDLNPTENMELQESIQNDCQTIFPFGKPVQYS